MKPGDKARVAGFPDFAPDRVIKRVTDSWVVMAYVGRDGREHEHTVARDCFEQMWEVVE